MHIGGFQKLSFIDFPDRISSVVFTQGCNWRCPWCHNPALVDPDQFTSPIPQQEIFNYLQSRKGTIEGVVVSGGEPTLQPQLEMFLTDLKSLGYPIKLDTNGSRPEVLQRLIDRNLLDFIAMDIKSGPENYPRLVGCNVDAKALQKSINIICASTLPHQFRTTIIPSLHTEQDADTIHKWLPPLEPITLQQQQSVKWNQEAQSLKQQFERNGSN